MTTTLVIDASVVVKWLVPEENSLKALSLRERYSFAGPDLLHAEIANIMWKKVRRTEITEEEALAGLSALRRAEFQLTRSEALMEQAFQLASLVNHPAYDCFYLCLAAKLGTVLVTADDRMIRKLAASGHTEWAAAAIDLRTF